MRYFSVKEMADKWNVSDNTVRNYCARKQIAGAIKEGRIWKIPENAQKPIFLRTQKENPSDFAVCFEKREKKRLFGRNLP
ncbi:helix-turn-helix domain-containing protein [uncultured Dubosiella sp.]|uniref:helix-turn-helix domain-containing protein n=1 Tax=uncultured Dubosiella sp. TaxID=1937011 RepID=UPI00263B28BA|nr:helix-turn-helix domain-containing protein [uncultured Dubosiella sp.]